MSFALAYRNGPAVRADRGRPLPRPTAGQIGRYRDEMWRRKHDEGTPDPITGRPARMSFRLIAALFETSEARVRAGVDRARSLQEELARALDA